MGVLSRIKKGRENLPPRLMIYGGEGIGKSTFAAGAPSPVFIQTEDGLGGMDVARFDLATKYPDVIDNIRGLRDEEHEFQTVVIDSVDWLERLIHDHVVQQDGATSIEMACGGYGRGYRKALDHFRDVLTALDQLRAKGLAVILVAHAKTERFEDPEHPAYDRYSPRLHKEANALLCEWVDERNQWGTVKKWETYLILIGMTSTKANPVHLNPCRLGATSSRSFPPKQGTTTPAPGTTCLSHTR